jgi:hypothetical protein
VRDSVDFGVPVTAMTHFVSFVSGLGGIVSEDTVIAGRKLIGCQHGILHLHQLGSLPDLQH